MIVDTSIMVAVSLGESTLDWIVQSIGDAGHHPLRMSWANIAEAAIILSRENALASDSLEEILNRMGIETLESDFAVTRLVAEARLHFPINFGDCFAYAHAKLRGEPLITLDADFLKTDLPRVLHPDAP